MFLFFFIIKFQFILSFKHFNDQIRKICQNNSHGKAYVSLSNNRVGFANQLLSFQYVIYNINFLCKNSSTIFMFKGPFSDHIQYKNLSINFKSFFRRRTVDECEYIIKSKARKQLCREYDATLDKIQFINTDVNIKIFKFPIVRAIGFYCLPWEHHSPFVKILHCPTRCIQEMLFFFEIYDFKNEIQIIGLKFLHENKISEKRFSALHFRGGDFSRRKFKNVYKPFPNALKSFTEAIQSKHFSANQYFMIQSKSLLKGSKLYYPENWILYQNGFEMYKNCAVFLKILIDIYISSKSSFFMGNYYSTLSEIVISYARLKNENISFSFY